jgi:hypothetical protein
MQIEGNQVFYKNANTFTDFLQTFLNILFRITIDIAQPSPNVT